ncbi:MAG: ATP-binding protein [bacterium]|nr:ATP-binding protein [bacterium]
MPYFIVAVGLAVVITLLYLLLRRYTPKFRSKLILIFICFLLIPTIPLTFLTLNLLTRNIDVWSNKRIVSALEDSFTISEKLKETQGEEGLDLKTRNKIQNIVGVLQIVKQLQLFKKSIKVILWLLFSVGVIMLVVAGVVIASRLSKGIERPIHNLVQGTQKITQGDFGYQIPVESKDEIGNLTDSFNKMSKDLETQREALKTTERLKAWQEIARRVSHEIKNPLTSIGISIDRLTPNLKEERDKECLTTIKEELENLRHLATEFSEFARMPEPNFVRCDLNEIVKSVVELYSGEQKIKVNYFKDIPDIFIDKNGIRRVLTNLIKNSIEAAGQISVSTSVDNEWAIVTVADTGSGISKDVLAKIFDPYVTTKYKGTGLGFTIAKKIIVDHQGEITINSEEGRGTIAVVKLPIKKKV